MKIFEGTMPDVTPAQLIAILLGGVPVIATLLNSFGIYDLSPEQQDALTSTLQWAGVLAIGLFGADAGLRAARNNADARVKAAMLPGPSLPPELPGASRDLPLAPDDDLLGAQRDVTGELPSDDEEFGPMIHNGHRDLEPVLPEDADDLGPDSRLMPIGPDDEDRL